MINQELGRVKEVEKEAQEALVEAQKMLEKAKAREKKAEMISEWAELAKKTLEEESKDIIIESKKAKDTFANLNGFEKILLIVDKKDLIERTDNNDTCLLRAKYLRNRKIHREIKLKLQHDLQNAKVAPALGSGFFIGESIVATAAHVILAANGYESTRIDDLRFISNFHKPESNKNNDSFIIPKKNIYMTIQSESLEKDCYDYAARGEDWALIKVTNEYSEFSNSTTGFFSNRSFTCADGDMLCVAGHPLGLPSYITTGEVICDHLSTSRNRHDNIFEAKLNIYSGHSGSPVLQINEGEIEVIGISVRGTRQFLLEEQDGNAQNPYKKQIHLAKILSAKQGEECQKITEEIKNKII